MIAGSLSPEIPVFGPLLKGIHQAQRLGLISVMPRELLLLPGAGRPERAEPEDVTSIGRGLLGAGDGSERGCGG